MNIIDFILHIDKHLEVLMADYNTTTYFILCLIIQQQQACSPPCNS